MLSCLILCYSLSCQNETFTFEIISQNNKIYALSIAKYRVLEKNCSLFIFGYPMWLSVFENSRKIPIFSLGINSLLFTIDVTDFTDFTNILC